MTVVNSKRFDGRAVLVTGGAGGLGRAVRAGFEAEGATVATVDPDGGDYPVDVTDAKALDLVCAEVADRYGRIDVLVCLAGGSLGTPRSLDELEPSDVDLVLDVNVKGTLYACRAALPYLRESRGTIVACGSIGGRQPSPVTGIAYATAKAAVGGLVRKLAREVGPDGVRVNAVAPGLFLTERVGAMFEALPDEEKAAVRAEIALGRMPELRELVEPVLFLAGEASSYVTGVTLDVNGGRFMPL
ncbi:SDR family NAD(P)-dependent oxidoreductase [Phytomonospora endophytica]|uniref:3-oxoacyl-[acyl-carrier protein] reductase n=1 Tax=Phytomonospora endophytica TaxID=714109 RepID=A0A841FSP8_9ACTN|nr:SDR family NAD(P)-dependent oxidoreductase [Phytomonospora endophytica]MBB6036337.1 3-oxoacyl-[acyl-carrier protein] reductase [Phytomonospora endophytica]GIG67244.1 oxidoreductase [Phytomonospora endophytica]